MNLRQAEKIAAAPIGLHRRGTFLRAVAVIAKHEPPTPAPVTPVGQYVLRRGRPVPVSDTLRWGRWFGSSNRHVAKTYVADRWVSTVFLGLDHAFGSGPPVLWETLVFEPPRPMRLMGRERMVKPTDDSWGGRYTSRAQALRDHERIVREVRRARAH